MKIKTLSVLGILSYKDEIYMVKRRETVKAFPGYHSFPGGKVDPQDDADSEEGILLKALHRECYEELNIHLKDVASDFLLIAVAETPSFQEVQFRTSFFLIELKEKINIQTTEEELEYGEWRSRKDWLQQYQQGKMLLVPPTIELLKKLNQSSQKRPWDLTYKNDDSQSLPLIESLCGIRQIFVPSCTLPPHHTTNAFLIGDQYKVLVDPSPKDEEQLNLLEKTLKSWGVDEIFLTHSHPDHSQLAPVLAKRLRVPLSLSQDTACRIRYREGTTIFHGLRLKYRFHGDQVTTWLGREVKVATLPGHDEGQLGLYDEDYHWFLVGDLFQGQGTVVISSPEGDMGAYLQSLKNVIEAQPKVILPSHGILLGGTQALSFILHHRQQREMAMLPLFKEGLDREMICHKIYGQLHPQLVGLAMANIDSHYRHLRRQGHF
jgi:ribonuclease/clavin/mitogillin